MRLNFFARLQDYWRRKNWPGDEYARWKGVTVGKGCRIFSNEFGDPRLITIGDDVTISTHVQLLTHDGSTWLFRDEKGRRFDYQRIEIGNHCFIGACSILLPGIRIGDRVIVGAGSVVTKSVPSGWVVAGNPARFICKFEELQERALSKYPSLLDFAGLVSEENIVSKVRDSWRPTLKK